MALTDLYIRDKDLNKIHKVGSDVHDAMWVDSKGVVHYRNLQTGDGCSGDGKNGESGYEFVPSEFGEVDEEEMDDDE